MTMQTAVVSFYGDDINTWRDEDGQTYAVIKKICENIPIDGATQNEKLKKDPYFRQYVKHGPSPMFRGEAPLGIRIDKIALWLSGISLARVSPMIHQKMFLYRDECGQALDEYWRGSGVAINPRRAEVALSPDVQAMVQSIAALAQMQQSMFGQYQQHTEAIATIQQRVESLEVRQDTGTGFFAVIAYAKKHGYRCSRFHAQSIGVKATKLCRQRGIEPGKVSDEHWVTVNTYPEDILDEIWPQVMGQ